MKKKCLSMLLCVCMGLGLMGCSSSSSPISSSSEEAATETVEEVVEEDTISEAVEETSKIEVASKPTASGNTLYGKQNSSGTENDCSEWFNAWWIVSVILDGGDPNEEDAPNGYDIYSVTFLDTDEVAADAVCISNFDSGAVALWAEEHVGDVDYPDSEYYNNYYYGQTLYDIYIAGEGGVDAPADFSDWFHRLYLCVSIDFNNCLYTGNVTDMSGLFYDCYNLKSLDLSSFDTSQIRDIGCLFDGCYSLEEIDVSNWDISQVENAGFAFECCSSLTSLDLSSWEATNITDFWCMFRGCQSLESLDMSGVIISSDARYSGMVNCCPLLNQSNVSLGGIDVSDSTVWSKLNESV